MTDRTFSVGLIAVVVGIFCLLVYLRTLSCGFINFDDPLYVLNNENIRTLDVTMLAWAFSSSHAGFWMPFTWISLAVDYSFWGLNPLGYHLTNILLHAANSGLVVLIADRVIKEQSTIAQPSANFFQEERGKYVYPATLLLAGLLWGVHPLRVESVAWVTERKDVLNGLFALLAVLAYLRYVRQRSVGESCLPAWLLSLLLFVFSLMSKSVTVVLPFVLLLLDWYPLGRVKREGWNRLLLEKVPFLLLSLAMSAVTIMLVADSNVLVPYDAFPLGQRIIVSGNAVFHYCRLLLFPLGLQPIYPFPNPLPLSFVFTTVLVIISSVVVIAAGKRRPWIITVFFCYLLPLLPVLAVFQNGDQIMAARFTYLPAVAVSIMVAAAFYSIGERCNGWMRGIAYAGIAAIIFWYAGMSVYLIGYWKDTGTYWSRMIELQPIGRAYSDRGRFYLEKGRYEEAVDDLARAAEIATQVGMPEAFNLYAIRGEALAKLGRHAEAVKDFNTAISSYSAPEYYYNRGLSLLKLGRKLEAAEDMRRGNPSSGQIPWYKAE